MFEKVTTLFIAIRISSVVSLNTFSLQEVIKSSILAACLFRLTTRQWNKGEQRYVNKMEVGSLSHWKSKEILDLELPGSVTCWESDTQWFVHVNTAELWEKMHWMSWKSRGESSTTAVNALTKSMDIFLIGGGTHQCRKCHHKSNKHQPISYLVAVLNYTITFLFISVPNISLFEIKKFRSKARIKDF